MPKVTFHAGDKQIEVRHGENLLRAAMLAGVQFSASCGGSGICGKCRLLVEHGEYHSESTARLTPQDQAQGYALACSTYVISDMTVRLPHDARTVDRQAIERAMLTSADPRELTGDVSINPASRRVYLELPEPSLEDNISDVDRLLRALTRYLDLDTEQIFLSLPLIKNVYSALRSSQWKVTVTVVDNGPGCEITQILPYDKSKVQYGLAVDIGTTTICAELVDLKTGEVASRRSDYNRQYLCGEDVISRIVYASRRPENLEHLQGLALKTINGLVREMLEAIGLQNEDISDIVIAGNTAMTHFFLGIDPGIREEPYVPVISAPPVLSAREFGLDWADGSKVYLAPCRAGYLGGDITAGILGSNVFRSDKLTLYIDVGTNGEIVLGGSKWLLGCSCSAGPAFEGGSIKHGMRAAAGAVEQVRINPETFEPMILTVGQARPRGICGSGLIDTMAEMFRAGVINSKGRFNTDLDTPRVRGQDSLEYVLVWAEDAGIDRDLVVTEGDLDNLLRAKAAVFAGITTLMKAVGVLIQDIDEMFIAGGFGRFLELDKAVTIGMLPEIAPEKVKFIGNGSLLGCRLMLLSRDTRANALQVSRKITYLELSRDTSFMEQYVSALFMPHTDLDLFPLVKKNVLDPRQSWLSENLKEAAGR